MATAIEMIDKQYMEHLVVLHQIYQRNFLTCFKKVTESDEVLWQSKAKRLKGANIPRFPFNQLNHQFSTIQTADKFFGSDVFEYLSVYRLYTDAYTNYGSQLTKLSDVRRELELYKYNTTSEDTLLGELLGEEHECDLMLIQAEADLQDAHKKFIDNRKQMRLKYPENTPVVYCQNVPTNQSMDE